MLVKTSIDSLCVLEKCLSLRFSTQGACPEIIGELKAAKGAVLDYSLASLQEARGPGAVREEEISFMGTVHSLSIRENLRFIIHAEIIKPLIFAAIEMMDGPVVLKFVSARERELLRLLGEAASAALTTPEDVLFEMSSFTARNGSFIEGKKSILALSEKQKAVIISKLKKYLEISHAGRKTLEAVQAGKGSAQGSIP